MDDLRTARLMWIGFGCTAAILVAAALVGLRDAISNADVVLVLVLVVVLAAAAGGREAGACTPASSSRAANVLKAGARTTATRPKPDYSLLGVDLSESVFEPIAGGRVYDRGVDGSECQWGRVVVYEPPKRLVFTWDISPMWQLESDQSKSSEVEVRFIEDGPDVTRVELEHRHLDRH